MKGFARKLSVKDANAKYWMAFMAMMAGLLAAGIFGGIAWALPVIGLGIALKYAWAAGVGDGFNAMIELMEESTGSRQPGAHRRSHRR